MREREQGRNYKAVYLKKKKTLKRTLGRLQVTAEFKASEGSNNPPVKAFALMPIGRDHLSLLADKLSERTELREESHYLPWQLEISIRGN